MTSYHIRFSNRAQLTDLPKIDASVRGAIAIAIEDKLKTAPEIFGKPPRHALRGLRVLRVGDWRVIFHTERNTVAVLAVRHRREGYKNLNV